MADPTLYLFDGHNLLYAGGFYGVNPIDQPGVELGKQLTYGLMGRPGYEASVDVEGEAGGLVGDQRTGPGPAR